MMCQVSRRVSHLLAVDIDTASKNSTNKKHIIDKLLSLKTNKTDASSQQPARAIKSEIKCLSDNQHQMKHA